MPRPHLSAWTQEHVMSWADWNLANSFQDYGTTKFPSAAAPSPRKSATLGASFNESGVPTRFPLYSARAAEPSPISHCDVRLDGNACRLLWKRAENGSMIVRIAAPLCLLS